MPGRFCLSLFCVGLLSLPVAVQADPIKPHSEGFWKVHPPRNVKAEYGKEDPMGLAYHRHIPTDCSIAWKDLSKGRGQVYCFSSPMSLQFFLEDPTRMLPEANAFWASEHAPRS